MNIIKKLTLIHLKQNSKRTLVTMIGIIISVAMITAVGAGYTSFMHFAEEYVIQSTGRWQVSYTGSVAEEVDFGKNVELHMRTHSLGYADFSKSINDYKPYMHVLAMNKDAFENLSLQLEEGRMPENDSEIVISRHLLENGGATYKLGDTISLKMGNRYVKEDDGTLSEALTQNNPFQSGEDNTEKETFIPNGETKKYKIVGIVTRPYFEPYSSPGYTVFTCLDDSMITKDSIVTDYFYFKHVSNKMIQVFESEQCYELNYHLLSYSGITRSNNMRIVFGSVGSFLMMVIMLGTISLIYNAFAISITDRSKQFGMLSSVGATGKQRKQAVLFEAGILSIICIPVGILSGLAGLGITFHFIGLAFQRGIDTTVPLTLEFTGAMAVIVVIVSLCTIFLSAWIPAKRASKMSTMDSIMARKDISYSANTVKTAKITRKLFGFEGELALKNQKRNKRQYRALTFSLMITFVLFTTLTTFMSVLAEDYEAVMDIGNYDMEIWMYNQGTLTDEKVKQIYTQIEQVDGVIQSSKMYNTWLDLYMDKENALRFASKETMDFLTIEEVQETYEMDMDSEEFRFGVDVYGLGEEEFQQYASSIGVSKKKIEELKDEPVILINSLLVPTSGVYGSYELLDVKAGDSITLTSEGWNWKPNLLAVTDQYPMGIENYQCFRIILVTTEAQVKSLAKQYVESSKEISDISYVLENKIYLKTSGRNALDIQDDIETIMKNAGVPEEDIFIDNYKEHQARQQSLVTVFIVFADGFIVLIALICIANLCNTISTSFELRRREFAILKSVGMEPKKFKKMVYFESLFYGLKALLYGIPISLLLLYWFYGSMAVAFYHTFQIPLLVYGVAILGMVIIISIGMFYASRKVTKENIMDGLRMQ